MRKTITVVERTNSKIDLDEAHHRDGSTVPLRAGDTATVYHGFRTPSEALRVAHVGLSGRERISRVYSYEADNNPHGLFVTISREVAEGFVGAYGTRTIAEFDVEISELQPPIWPNGSYTVQGQYAQYFGHGAEGRRNRNDSRKEQTRELSSRAPDMEIAGSDDPMLAHTLFRNTEKQALFMGHLPPSRITCFWVEHDRHDWKPYTVAEYISEFGKEKEEKSYLGNHWSKVFGVDEEFDGEVFLARLSEEYNQMVPDLEGTIRGMWRNIMDSRQHRRSNLFVKNFGMYFWPKQLIPAMQWMRERFGR